MISIQAVKQFAKQYGPTILSGLAIVGVAATGYLAHKAGAETGAKVLMEHAGSPEEADQIAHQVIKREWKRYIPPVASGVFTIGCIVAADRWHVGKETALLASCLAYKNSSEIFENKVRRELGQKAVEEAKQDAQAKNFVGSLGCKMKIWEPYTKQWFEASQQELLWCELTANKMMAQIGEVKLNDILAMFPSAKKTPRGAEIGWSWDDESFNELASYYYAGGWIDLCPQLCEKPNGETYFNLEYGIHPNELEG